MRCFFAPNIDGKGRLIRGLMGATLLVGATFSFGHSVWGGMLLAAAGLFCLVEAARAWCLARACGIKTKR
ncbi:MAG TPA: DUF2892 domain-containing protein [Verrucomicrobiota bacterium]|mgnify:CR=1 FL=1|nr:DUF2892 domain-containing protein [Verrucomicrobiota bacterium]